MQLPTSFNVPTRMTKSQLAKISQKATEVAQLGFGLNYKRKWTIWMAVREFVQNAYDVISERDFKNRASLAEVELKWDSKNKVGYIIDRGKGIKLKNLFLQEAPRKRSDVC